MTIPLTEINRAEVLQYLGWRGSEIPPEVSAQLDGCMNELLSLAEPRVVWKLFQTDELPEDLLVGNDIRALLGQPLINEDWAWKHFMTKNYADIEKVLTALVEGEKT